MPPLQLVRYFVRSSSTLYPIICPAICCPLSGTLSDCVTILSGRLSPSCRVLCPVACCPLVRYFVRYACRPLSGTLSGGLLPPCPALCPVVCCPFVLYVRRPLVSLVLCPVIRRPFVRYFVRSSVAPLSGTPTRVELNKSS